MRLRRTRRVEVVPSRKREDKRALLSTCTARVLTHLEQLSHPNLRADPPSEQQVHSKVSLRRAVDAV
jgi:hypothetical protein